MKGFLLLLLILSAVAFVFQAQAQIPRLIPYQGLMTDSKGRPKPDGNYTIMFRLYDAVSSTVPIWSEQKIIAVKGGQMSTTLGDRTPFGAAIKFDREYWLGIQIGTDPEMSPRITFLPVPYTLGASRADVADKISSPAAIQDRSITPAKLDTTGAKAGQVLSYDGQSVKWAPASGSSTPDAPTAVWRTLGNNATVYGTHFLGTVDSVPLSVRTNNLERVFVGATGDVGIGKNTPEQKLDVAGTAQMTGFKMPTGASAGKVLTSDATGVGTWQTASGGGPPGWLLTGNAGTNAAANFLGTSDSVPLELRVNGARAFRMEPDPISPNIIGGYSGNVLTFGVVGATISGGGRSDDGVGQPDQNIVSDDFGTIGGGQGNQAGDAAGTTSDRSHATVGGGLSNVASGVRSTVGGGYNNAASAQEAFIGGGSTNQASALGATVGGGGVNIAAGQNSTIAGGGTNTADGLFATIGGGFRNQASAQECFVGGGSTNTAGGVGATVGGGGINIATGQNSTIAGGGTNTASGLFATITGGFRNSALAQESFVGGGSTNTAAGLGSTVGGGGVNIATGFTSTIGGGGWNRAGGNYSVVGGGGGPSAADSNSALGGASTISGGRANMTSGPFSAVGGGHINEADGQESFIGGGLQNTAGGYRAVIGGGFTNTASAQETFIGGGSTNSATAIGATVAGGGVNAATGTNSTIGGGGWNRAGGNFSVIGGGGGPSAADSNSAPGGASTIGGGRANTATAPFSTVPGGVLNSAGGSYSFAAGRRAKAADLGSFVWADGTDADFSSSASNEFNVRSSGGVRIFSAADLSTGVTLAAGSGSWSSVSDSTKKRNARLVDAKEIVAKLMQLPIKRWSYRSQDPSIEHIGPMAQDFYALFGLGDANTTISTIDPAGVALAAIQELCRRNEDLKVKNEELSARLVKLETAVQSLLSSKAASGDTKLAGLK